MARYSRRRPHRRRRPSRRGNRPYLIIGLIIIIAAGWAAMSMGDKDSPQADGEQTAVGAQRTQQVQGLSQNSLVKQAVDDAELAVSPAEDQLQTHPSVRSLENEQPNEKVSEILTRASALHNLNSNRLVEVRVQLNDALKMPMSHFQRLNVQDKLALLAQEWLFSRTIFEGEDLCEFYSVKTGDNLEAIGRKYQVPYEIIMQINDIPNPQALRAGVRIKVPKGPFHVKVYKETFTLDLFLQNTYVKSYEVGLGVPPDHETPTGLWVVRAGGKAIRPSWTDTETGRVYNGHEPDYPLGDRWIPIRGIEGDAVGRSGFALHGTNEPETIGTLCSNGCVRLRNEDIVELYGLLYDEASQVRIVD